jgi:hypothetical protein
MLTETLKLYVKSWKMWNTWMVACERPEIEFENFIESGFCLNEHTIVGQDNGYDVEIYDDSIHISFRGKPRYTWWPYITGYGGLPKDENPDCRLGVRSRLKLTKFDTASEPT